MDNGTITSSIALKWRESAEGNTVTCHLGPIEQPDETDEWLHVMTVNRSILQDDPVLYEDLVVKVSDWLLRVYAAHGLPAIEMQRWPGGINEGSMEKQ
jgi:hypothetical protein